jgi:hypothetical protein
LRFVGAASELHGAKGKAADGGVVGGGQDACHGGNLPRRGNREKSEDDATTGFCQKRRRAQL